MLPPPPRPPAPSAAAVWTLVSEVFTSKQTTSDGFGELDGCVTIYKLNVACKLGWELRLKRQYQIRSAESWHGILESCHKFTCVITWAITEKGVRQLAQMALRGSMAIYVLSTGVASLVQEAVIFKRY